MKHPAMLISFAGLPGTGKSTLARELAFQLGAFWLRIDSIEEAIHQSGVFSGAIAEAGYRAAYAVAEDNLRLGRTDIGDCVNDWMLTRNAWRDAGLRAGANIIEIEVICSDTFEHRRRIEARPMVDVGLGLPDWKSVVHRDYHPWDRNPTRIDTAGRSVAECVATIKKMLPQHDLS